MKQGRILFRCKDRTGIDEQISHVLASAGYNLTSNHGEAMDGYWFLRKEFSGQDVPIRDLREIFQEVIAKQDYEDSFLKITDSEEKKKTAILVTKETHCLEEILHAWKNNEIGMNLKLVAGNYEDCRPIAEHYGVDFRYVDMNGAEKEQEALPNILSEIEDTKLLLLAKFMRILPKDFIQNYPGAIINVHHGLLPGFIGAKPYDQAYNRGVKTIGATAHFVTEKDPGIDSGPIICESTEDVSTERSPERYKIRGKVSERNALRKAVRLFCEDRIITYGALEKGEGKTFIFP